MSAPQPPDQIRQVLRGYVAAGDVRGLGHYLVIQGTRHGQQDAILRTLRRAFAVAPPPALPGSMTAPPPPPAVKPRTRIVEECPVCLAWVDARGILGHVRFAHDRTASQAHVLLDDARAARLTRRRQEIAPAPAAPRWPVACPVCARVLGVQGLAGHIRLIHGPDAMRAWRAARGKGPGLLDPAHGPSGAKEGSHED